MARRTRNTENSTPNEVQEDTVSTVTEAPEAPAEVEAPADSTTETEAPAEAKTEKPAEKPIDLTAFKAAVDNAVANKDTSTGELAVAFVEPVTAAYRELDGVKAKNKAKAELNERMREAMNSMDIVTARTYLVLTDALSQVTGGGHKAEKTPADPTEAFVQRVVGLRLALQLASDAVPEGVEDGWQDKAKALFDESIEAARGLAAWVKSDAEDKGDEPETSGVVKAAVKLSQGKAARVGKSGGSGVAFTGERRDIAKHIQNAFADKEPGTFLLIAEIKNTRSDEYGDNPPSAGAISARLFPSSGKCTVEGVRPETNEKGRKGAVKI